MNIDYSISGMATSMILGIGKQQTWNYILTQNKYNIYVNSTNFIYFYQIIFRTYLEFGII